MTLRVTEIPSSYRLGGFTAALEPARMTALFAYGERCAVERRIWATALTVLNRVAQGQVDAPGIPARCPVPATRGERRP